MKRNAGMNAFELMKYLRADLAAAKAEGDKKALAVHAVYISSGYRDPIYDRNVWDEKYPSYYKETANARDNKHDDNAVNVLVKYIRHYKAAPGYSNHTNGLAFDIVTTEGGTHYTTDHHQNKAWESTWIYNWLSKNARTYHFQRIETEAWHWEYKG